jgi:hypothetical protein
MALMVDGNEKTNIGTVLVLPRVPVINMKVENKEKHYNKKWYNEE